jgi:tetratricopeptide (TPR) repeat protein
MTDAVLRNCGLAVVLAVAACRHRPQAATDELRDLTRLVHEERYDLALAKTDKGLRRAESSGDLRLKWRFRLLKVEILLGRRMAPQALALLDTYGNPPESPEWAEERGRALLFRGQAAYTEGRLGEAHDLLSRAATAASEAGSPSLSAEVKLRRGTLSAMRGRFDDAHEALQEALGAAKTVHDPYLEARVTSNLGFTFFAESRYAEAISWYERSLGLSERLGAVESVPRADGNLGNCYARLGDYDNAVLHQMRAQDAFAKAGNLYEQQLFLGNSGNNSFAAEDYAAAAAAWERALRIARQVPAPVWIARWLNNLATVSIEREDWNAAERFNSEALALKRKLGLTSDEASSINNAARIAVSRNRFEEAMKLFQEALSLQSEDPTVQLEARSGIAGLFIRSGRPGDASAEFETTLAEIDRRGANLLKDDYKLSYLASLIRFHGQYVDFLMANHQPERALEVAESSRSRVLVGRSGGVPGIERGTSRDYQRLAARANAVLLEFWIGSKQSYLWVVTPEHVTHHVLPSKTALHALIEHYRAVTMADRNTLEIAGDTGTKLYNALQFRDPAGRTGGKQVLDRTCHRRHCAVTELPGADDSQQSLSRERTEGSPDRRPGFDASSISAPRVCKPRDRFNRRGYARLGDHYPEGRGGPSGRLCRCSARALWFYPFLGAFIRESHQPAGFGGDSFRAAG